MEEKGSLAYSKQQRPRPLDGLGDKEESEWASTFSKELLLMLTGAQVSSVIDGDYF